MRVVCDYTDEKNINESKNSFLRFPDSIDDSKLKKTKEVFLSSLPDSMLSEC